MPRYYCDYCDTYLTHDSPSVRKQHNAGYKHKANVRTYYQQYEAQLNQNLIDQRVKEHLGQAGAYPPVGAAYNQLRPRLPILPTPVLPIAGNPQVPANSLLIPGARAPVLPRPILGAPGYMSAPAMAPIMAPPGATTVPGQVNGISRPMTVNGPTVAPGSTSTPTSSGAPSMLMPSMYQGNPAVPSTGGFDSSNMAAQASEGNI